MPDGELTSEWAKRAAEGRQKQKAEKSAANAQEEEKKRAALRKMVEDSPTGFSSVLEKQLGQ